jgi:hypothetical protein
MKLACQLLHSQHGENILLAARSGKTYQGYQIKGSNKHRIPELLVT